MLLLKQLLLEQVNLTLEIWDARSLLLCIDQVPLNVLDLVLQAPDVLHLLLVVDLALLEGGLLDLDLFV